MIRYELASRFWTRLTSCSPIRGIGSREVNEGHGRTKKVAKKCKILATVKKPISDSGKVLGKTDLTLRLRRQEIDLVGASGARPRHRDLSKLPIEAPYHSVVGQQRPGPKERGSDGVVPYGSSHLDGAQSESIVRGGHGVFSNSDAVLETIRILHLEQGSSVSR